MKQKLKFAQLYRDNKAAVEKALAAMWCGEIRNESQEAYAAQLQRIISEIFAPKNAMPLVQCMNSYESIHDEHVPELKTLIGDLWEKTLPTGEYYLPYQHQYHCWNSLLKEKTADGKMKSIVVTTGTGSGKTECFMIPLVRDLLDHKLSGYVQAIFIYPLNALMEDQKDRLETLVKDTNLTYSVYNSDLPERIPSPHDRNYKKIMRKIDAIKGIKRDENGKIIEEKYPHCIGTREELRENPANILLTNPTMLEYIMLRDKDSSLIKEDSQSLRWLVLDETHTYTGAGASEMAMLIRRILLAYGVTTDDVRFATSSATIGDSTDEEKQLELKKFIAELTGLRINQVEYVRGDRKGIDTIPDDEYKKYWLKLINENKAGYLRLNELFGTGESIEQMLDRLDEMCSRVEDLGLTELRAKVHFFYRVPNQGLYVDISDNHFQEDGSFRVLTDNKPQLATEKQAPLLELNRCKHCGEYLTIAEEAYGEEGIVYQPIASDDSDMFDLDIEEKTGKTIYVFGTTKNEGTEYDNNVPYHVKGNELINVTASHKPSPGWRLIANTQCSCPYCGTKLTRSSKNTEEDLIQTDEDSRKLQKFRVAPDFVSRLIAPSTLDLMTEFPAGGNKKPQLHRGQQYLSFVDSRQSAARSTIKQNLEEEKLWVYGTIFHELCRKGQSGRMTKTEAQAYYEGIANDTSLPILERQKAMGVLVILQGDDAQAIERALASAKQKSTLSWQEIFTLLFNDKYADTFCEQFAERTELSSEIDDNGNVRDGVKRKYILSIMVEYLSKRPLSSASPETMGLFTSYYEKLKTVTANALPQPVDEFNAILSKPNKISLQDWHNLLQVFMDFSVRSNESVYLNMFDEDSIDIFKCVRFATQKERRRPVHKPEIYDDAPNNSRIVRLLAKLIAEEKHITLEDAIKGYKVLIEGVVQALWKALTEDYCLLNHSTHFDDDPNVMRHVKDKDEIIDDIHYPQYRLNLKDLGFKLYDDVFLCDTNVSRDGHHVECLRPVETTFHGYSPYLINGSPVFIEKERHENWDVFPYYNGSEESNPEDSVIEAWAKEHRSLLWNYNIWGPSGVFSNRLLQIYQFPDLFIQAEHTAQVDKIVLRQAQDDFKAHAINILACSTTMEMGVNLGDLELVMLTSVPPQPSNYKQRAGRSGRRGQVRSACVTLCGSDALGIRTLYDPMSSLILRETSNPTVDLNSEQIIQRHVNSFLVRESGVFAIAGGSVTEQVLDYYTNYELVPDGESNHVKIKNKDDHKIISPTDGLGEEHGTPYAFFNDFCAQVLPDGIREKLSILLEGTVFCDKVDFVVSRARIANERCYAELEMRLQDLAEPYKKAKSAKQQSFFEMKFIEPLATRLLSYWATHRFIPNANMPVNVIEFDVNASTSAYYSMLTVSNPSYPLRTALSQYAPGNPIAMDGIVRIVRGIRYTDFFNPEVTFKNLYYNREQVVIDTKDDLDNLEKWPVNAQVGLELLQPAEFIPDMNESANRILENNIYTRVNAQLIGTEEWMQDRIEPHLFDTRSSKESSGQILYYNEGLGYGYCHCTKCGKTVLERWTAATANDPDKLPAEMNTVQPKDSDKDKIHFSLVKTSNRPSRCIGCGSLEYIKRNVVLGDTIQTDYTEIRIRHLNNNWINGRRGKERLLTTLGILFTSGLAEELNIERSDLDFTITPNGHICIFDTNPGGSGYANQLDAIDVMKSVIDRSAKTIEVAEKTSSKDALIDRYSLHYINLIDIFAAKEWITEEITARKTLPAAIQSTFEDATETSLSKMEQAFALSLKESVLFVDDDFNKWDYDGSSHSWRSRFFSYFAPKGQFTTLCVAANSDESMGEPNKAMIRLAKGWVKSAVTIKNPYKDNGIYPLAYIEGRLYYTNNPEHITLNDRWGNGTIYCSRTRGILKGAVEIDTSIPANNTRVFTIGQNDSLIIKSTALGELIKTKSDTLISDFISHCKSHSQDGVSFVYQDEHMKSVLAMVICLQTIGYFIKEIGHKYTLEFKIERYEDNNGRSRSLTINQPTSLERDRWLNDLAKGLVDELENVNAIEGTLVPIVSGAKRSLTHWRVLEIVCAGKKISIYPDGGFANGWQIYNDPASYQRYDINSIDYDTVVGLIRNQDIKYDVTREDV